MAKLIPNPLLPGVTGTIENMVFRNVNGTIIVSKKPDMSRAVKNPSPKQVKNRERMKEADAYAKNIKNNPELNAAFAAKLKKGQYVYTAAISEYYKLNAPKQ